MYLKFNVFVSTRAQNEQSSELGMHCSRQEIIRKYVRGRSGERVPAKNVR